MLRVLACVTLEHDLRLVALAGLICLLACFTAFSLVSRARGSASERGRVSWVAAAATVTGSGVWATHFVAMLAYRPGLPLGYDLDMTMLSVVVAIAIVGAGFAIGLSHRNPVLLAGAVAGAGIGTMHYIGMAAVQVPAAIHYDPLTVVLSLAIGMALGAWAFSLHRREPGLIGTAAAAVVFTLAICGLHFTAMSAITLAPDAALPLPDAVASPEWLAVAVAAVTLMIIVLSLAGSVMDQHLAEREARETERLRTYVGELELAKQELEMMTDNLAIALEQADASNLAKSQFLATMSHELRTPLNAIIGFSETMLSELWGPLGDAHYADYTSHIRDSGAHLLEIITDILDFAKMDAGELQLREEDIDIAELLAWSVRMIAGRAAAASVALHREEEPALPKLRADPRRIKQVLLNLLSNGVKFTPSGGTVTLAARRRGQEIVISVTDTGMGIAAADIPRALQPFGQIDNRLARAYEGTGLGLPLCKQLMELHGGSLLLESDPGVGTVVTIAFPAERVVEAGTGAPGPDAPDPDAPDNGTPPDGSVSAAAD